MSEKKNNSSEVPELKKERILSTGQAIVYALPNLGLTAILGITVSFTVLFYVNIMGQPPIIAGGIFAASLFVYSMMAIFGGALSDKFGKKKLMIISGPILAITFILIWIPPIPTVSYGTAFIPLIMWMIICTFTFRIMVGWFQPSMYALLPELSTDEQNRIKVSMINMLVMILGAIIGTIGPIIMMGNATESLDPNDPQLYYLDSAAGRTIYFQIQVFSTLICVMFLVLLVIMLFIIEEPPKERKKASSLKEILKDISEPMKDKNYFKFMLSFFLFWIPFMIFQFLILNLATFVIQLRGSEFIIMAVVAFIFAIVSFVVWSKLSEKYGIKKTLTICLSFASVAFSLIIILIIPMPHEMLVIVGLILITLCLCSLVGTMVFPIAIISDIVDQAESKTGKSLSGSYAGAFIMMGSLASATAMIIISICLQIFGPEAPISYGLVFALGAGFIVLAIIIFQKVEIVGTDIK